MPVDSAKEWCDPMVVTPKPIIKVRVCVDRTKLNEHARITLFHPSMSPWESWLVQGTPQNWMQTVGSLLFQRIAVW